MDVKTLCTNIRNNKGIAAAKRKESRSCKGDNILSTYFGNKQFRF